MVCSEPEWISLENVVEVFVQRDALAFAQVRPLLSCMRADQAGHSLSLLPALMQRTATAMPLPKLLLPNCCAIAFSQGCLCCRCHLQHIPQ